MNWILPFTFCLLLFPAPARAQEPRKLSLKEAEEIAVKNNPRVSAALLTALAANEVTLEVRSAFQPTAFASLTSAGASENARIAAGALNNPIIFSRIASGFSVSQIITDFGRTANLAESANLRARAQDELVKATRSEVLIQVDRAYYAALRAESVSRVAEQTVGARQLVVDQVSALAQSKLKSGLDLSFASVSLSEARLLLINARNEIKSAFADLSLALGFPATQTFTLTEEPLPAPLETGAAPLIKEALGLRPDLSRFRLEIDAAHKFADAERDLRLPTISAVGSIGALPIHDDRLPDRYGAVGVNVNFPIFNGRLFSARRAEAELRARAIEQQTRDLENRIGRDVEVAWLNANSALQRLDVTAQLLEQATSALDLAQARYDLGLSSIVELSQAQLNKTSAEIASAGAKYEYQTLRSVLNYQIGALR